MFNAELYQVLAQEMLPWLGWADHGRLSRVSKDWRQIITAMYSTAPTSIAFANEHMLVYHQRLIHPIVVVRLVETYWGPDTIGHLLNRVAWWHDSVAGSLDPDSNQYALGRLWSEWMMMDRADLAQCIPAYDWRGRLIQPCGDVHRIARRLAESLQDKAQSAEVTHTLTNQPANGRGKKQKSQGKLSHIKVTPTIRVLAAVHAAKYNMRAACILLLDDATQIELATIKMLLRMPTRPGRSESWLQRQFDTLQVFDLADEVRLPIVS